MKNNKLAITDMNNPAIFIEVGNERPMYEELAQACKECEKSESLLPEQMCTTNYLEVMT